MNRGDDPSLSTIAQMQVSRMVNLALSKWLLFGGSTSQATPGPEDMPALEPKSRSLALLPRPDGAFAYALRLPRSTQSAIENDQD